MSAKSKPEIVTPMVAALRAIEHIAIARRFVQAVGASLNGEKEYSLYRELDADLDVAAAKAKSLLGAVPTKA
jgi:hypothetical protein